MPPAIQEWTHVFEAFADPLRIRILNLLLNGELCVCELCSLLRENQPKLSRHLAYLRSAGMVVARRDAKWKYYRIPDELDPLRRDLLRCVQRCLRQLKPLKEDLKRLEKHPRDCCVESDSAIDSNLFIFVHGEFTEDSDG